MLTPVQFKSLATRQRQRSRGMGMGGFKVSDKMSLFGFLLLTPTSCLHTFLSIENDRQLEATFLVRRHHLGLSSKEGSQLCSLDTKPSSFINDDVLGGRLAATLLTNIIPVTIVTSCSYSNAMASPGPHSGRHYLEQPPQRPPLAEECIAEKPLCTR